MIPYAKTALALEQLLREEDPDEMDIHDLVERILKEGGGEWLVQREVEKPPKILTQYVSFCLAGAVFSSPTVDTDRLALALFERTVHKNDPSVLTNLCTTLQRGRMTDRPWIYAEHPLLRELLQTAAEGTYLVTNTLIHLLEILRGKISETLWLETVRRLQERGAEQEKIDPDLRWLLEPPSPAESDGSPQ
ncbi:MAG TPA: hypothetical protein PLA94_26230 [Myxococcota bacterium]|nr:hypothetical protein [Myxococcota bacterium]